MQGLFTWIALANQRPSGGYNSNDAITMLVVPAGLGVLGGLVCFFIQAIRVYAIGGKWYGNNVLHFSMLIF